MMDLYSYCELPPQPSCRSLFRCVQSSSGEYAYCCVLYTLSVCTPAAGECTKLWWGRAIHTASTIIRWADAVQTSDPVSPTNKNSPVQGEITGATFFRCFLSNHVYSIRNVYADATRTVPYTQYMQYITLYSICSILSLLRRVRRARSCTPPVVCSAIDSLREKMQENDGFRRNYKILKFLYVYFVGYPNENHSKFLWFFSTSWIANGLLGTYFRIIIT
jgi:hypothetical protein